MKSNRDIREDSIQWSDDRDYARKADDADYRRLMRQIIAAGNLNERKQYGSLSLSLFYKNLSFWSKNTTVSS